MSRKLCFIPVYVSLGIVIHHFLIRAAKRKRGIKKKRQALVNNSKSDSYFQPVYQHQKETYFIRIVSYDLSQVQSKCGITLSYLNKSSI